MRRSGISIIAIIAILFSAITSQAQHSKQTLDTQEISALQQALDDEYKAWSIYDRVIKDFGEVRPFVNIREAESRHIQALLSLFKHYNISPSKNRWIGNVPTYNNINEACKAAAMAEIENVALYNKLLNSTTKQDILGVYNALQQASEKRHLPAFQRCAG